MHHTWILSDWNKLFLKGIYISRVSVTMAVCRMVRYSYFYHFLIGFKCIFQLYISVSSILWYGYRYHMDIHTMWHCALVSCTPSPSIGLVFGCALSWCSVSLCVPFINSLVEWHFIIMVAIIIGIFMGILNSTVGFLWLGSFGSTHLHGCFCPWTFSLNSGFDKLPSDYFVSCLEFLLWYSTREL